MMMMQVAQLNMSLDVPNASLKENTSVSFVHLSSVLFKRFSFKNPEESSYDFVPFF